MKMTTMELTKEQRDKISKLEKELASKKRYEIDNADRLLRSAEKYGIPRNLIDLDVIRYGILFGLIKSTKGGDDNNVSLLDMFKDNSKQYDYDIVPKHFRRFDKIVTEQDRLTYQMHVIKGECTRYLEFVDDSLRNDIEKCKEFTDINVYPLEVTTLTEVYSGYIDSIKDELTDGVGDDDLWNQYYVLRECLVGLLSICDYRSRIFDEINYINNLSGAVDRLSPIESWIHLFPSGFECKQIERRDLERLRRGMVIKYYDNDRTQKKFNMTEIYSECCTPYLMFFHAKEIVKTCVISPYLNSSIAYLKYDDASYYLLKDIVGGGIRLWVLDPQLVYFTSELQQYLDAYCSKLFATIYVAIYGDRKFNERFLEIDTLVNLLDSLNWIRDFKSINRYVMKTVSEISPLIPTELDFFNSIASDRRSLSRRKRYISTHSLFSDEDNIVQDKFVDLWPNIFTRKT